jgi:hypothetical protein
MSALAILIDTKVFRLLKDHSILAEIASEHDILEHQHEHDGRSRMSADAPVSTSISVKAPFKENPDFLIWTIQTCGWGAASRRPETILKEASALSLQDAFTLWLYRDIKRLPKANEVVEVA